MFHVADIFLATDVWTRVNITSLAKKTKLWFTNGVKSFVKQKLYDFEADILFTIDNSTTRLQKRSQKTIHCWVKGILFGYNKIIIKRSLTNHQQNSEKKYIFSCHFNNRLWDFEVIKETHYYWLWISMNRVGISVV